MSSSLVNSKAGHVSVVTRLLLVPGMLLAVLLTTRRGVLFDFKFTTVLVLTN